MIKKQYSGNARRARNIIWNAAGRYDFDPPFMSFFPDGKPDYYMDMIVGLADKWLDLQKLWEFFASYETERRAEEFDSYLWLGLENCLYEKEVQERPQMEQLRRERAELFFRMQEGLSRQQMEYQSMPVYTQQEARWAAVLGKRGPVLSPRQKQMAEALRFSMALGTEGVLKVMSAFLAEFFHFVPEASSSSRRQANPLARLILKREHRRIDRLIVRTGTGEGDHPKAVQQRHEGLGRHTGPSAEDEAYIREVFGPSVVSAAELRILENELCVEEDEGCRLWIASGRSPEHSENKDALEVRLSAEEQKKRNEAFLREHAAEAAEAVKKLSTRLETVFSSYFRPLPEPSRRGRLRTESAYRLPVLNDPKVFLQDGEETEPEIAVDLLLDASQSRMNVQEILSNEAYILAKSLEKTHIPVRVLAFRSLRGYTVLEVLKPFASKDCGGIMSYFAGGWNRDALAIAAAGRLNDDPALPGRKRILLVLTDASPNDSTPLAGSGGLLPREYEGAAAVRAAEDTVRALRSEGLLVGAVFHGNSSHLENVSQIYGHAWVRIQKAAQLAQGVSDLLLMLMREVRSD
ncbi:MAG: hypothetical protein IKR93_01200 [Firmicutes bacterium]|nr:hypothetical protein [Bacillota bacterium]